MLDKVEGIAAGNIHLPNRMPFTRLIKSGRASGSPYPLHAELKIVLAGINQRSINEQKEKELLWLSPGNINGVWKRM